VQTKCFLRNESGQCLTNSFGQIITSSLPALSTLLKQFQVSVFGKGSRSAAAPSHANIDLVSMIPQGSSDRVSGETDLIISGGVGCQGEESIHNLDDDAHSVTTSSIMQGCNAAKVEQNL
jgi:hypothetical protein